MFSALKQIFIWKRQQQPLQYKWTINKQSQYLN